MFIDYEIVSMLNAARTTELSEIASFDMNKRCLRNLKDMQKAIG